ncbi:MAG: aminotransferase class III-fold pyridoxal phosphate-dependent enzyme [Hyphomonadaceae bacterium]|nr:aminotransferase class III-fold pyridoxal phosphate-dependent enzyme [Hyphomonadaceae bacterium]
MSVGNTDASGSGVTDPATRAIMTFYQGADLADAKGGAPVHEFIKGQGIYLETTDGLKLMDGMSSFYVAGLGFCHPELVEALAKQAGELSFFVNAAGRLPDTAIRLSDKLAALAPVRDAYVAYGNSGSEANEFALKLLRMRALFRGEGQRTKVLTRAGSYHGGTFVAGSMTKVGKENVEYGLPLSGFLKLTQPDFARQAMPGESEADFVTRLVEEAENILLREGPETVLAFVAEPVSFSAGIAPPPAEYFPRMQALFRSHGIACIADEVITGFGRYAEFFACSSFGYEPDCITMAKGITGGHFPLSALILSGEIYHDVQAAIASYGGFSHGSTYAGHPVGAAVALKVIEILERPGFFPDVHRKIGLLAEGIGEIGTLAGIKFTNASGLGGVFEFGDQTTGKTGAQAAQAFADLCFKSGLIIRAAGPAVLFTPPLVTSDDELSAMFKIMKAAILAVAETPAAAPVSAEI